MTSDSSSRADDRDEIEFRHLFLRVWHGIPQIFALGLLGAGIAIVAISVDHKLKPAETSLRVAFSFPGFERGQYPDGSNFQPDDLRAADLVAQALKNLNLLQSAEAQSTVRGAISVSGIIPANISKERDRLRAAGQPTAPYIPDEYTVSLSLPRDIALSSRERELFLNELVSLFQTRFQRLYVEFPFQYGTAFAALKGSDYFEYELVLSQELRNLREFLTGRYAKAKNFRSPSTGLSFNDLITQADFYSQLRVNGVMGMIYSLGLTNNRELALRKIDYQLSLLNDNEQRLLEEERVVQDLLAKVQVRPQSYVLGAKSQTETDHPFVDQGLLDSLIANDAYNFLVRRALDAGLKVQEVHSELEQVLERRKRVESFNHEGADQTESKKLLAEALRELEADYDHLIQNVRKTNQDFTQQEFADTVRVTMRPTTMGLFHELLMGAGLGLAVGFIIGGGLSLLEVYIPRRPLISSASHSA